MSAHSSNGSVGSPPAAPAQTPFFLRPETVASHCKLASLPDAAVPPLQQVAATIGGDPELKSLAESMHQRLFGEALTARPDPAPVIAEASDVGECAPQFFLLLALSGLPRARRFHRSRQIPEAVCRATYQDIALWATEYHEEHGEWGIRPQLLRWFMNHLWGALYRLGRLQFMFKAFPGELVAFRHRQTREVVALIEDKIKLRSDGQYDGTSDVFDPAPWESQLVIDAKGARGNPISPEGYVRRTQVLLPADEWEQVLQRGDTMLDIHIPAGEPMSHAACGESHRLALDFFRTHFPERPAKGFCCTSWLLDSQWPDLLPPTANIVRFMQEFYCYPYLSNGEQTFERVFGERPADLAKAPRDTALRRVILDHLLAGGHLRSGGVFLLTEDLDWGRQVYLRQAVGRTDL